MSAIGVQSQINRDRALWLSTIPSDVIHGDIICDTISANAGYISTLYTENLEVSTLKASTLSLTTSDVSGMYVSSLRGNTAFFSTFTLASDLSGGVGFVRFSVDASGIQVDGDPIRFDNLLYITSSINIVQVSTIIDTDIFAQNGFFSTISTGNLSSGLASIRDANISSLFVSSLTALDLSGDFAENWSQYPTQNSSIIFQPAYILSNVNQKLYFAGQELTDASGGGIDWSYFPAQTDVSMNNFSLRGLSTLEYQDGGKLYSLTGNDLFYNGQPVQFGAASNISQWANYPAVNTIQTGGFPISSLGNINLVANSNIRILADSVSTVADQGLLNPTVNSDINLTAQNGLKGRINLTANPGVAGLFGEVNITANGGTTGGIGTGGLVTINANTPLGFSNATSAVKINAAGVNSYAGAIPSVGSLAGYNFMYGMNGVNICAGLPPAFPNIPFTTYLYGTAGVTTSSDFYCPNIYPYYNGLTTPPDLNITGRVTNLQQVYVNLSNVKHLYMQGAADIQNANYVSTVSTVGQSANFNTGIFTTLGAGTGVFLTENSQTLNAGTISTSLVTAPLLSTININLSTINGVNWQDLSGGGGGSAISSFQTVTTSSINVSSLNQIGGTAIKVAGTLEFASPNSLVNCVNINLGQTNDLTLNGNVVNLGGNNNYAGSLSTIRLQASNIKTNTLLTNDISANYLNLSSLQVSTIGVQSGGVPVQIAGGLKFQNPNSIENVLNINTDQSLDVSVFADRFGVVAFNTLIGSLSTQKTSANFVKLSTLEGATGVVDVSGGMFVSDTIELPLATGGINFDDGSGTNYTRLMRRDVAANNMLSVVNNTTLPAPEQINMMPLGVGELWLTGSSDEYQAVRLYSQFPFGNYELDAIDADGATLFAYIQGYYNGSGLNPGFLQAYSNVSSISGYNSESATNPYLNVIGSISTGNLNISTINGAAYSPGGGGGTTSIFSTIFVSSLNFSSATSYSSNTAFNYPIFIEHDAAGAVSGSGAAIAVSGHNYSGGAVIQQIEMGWRVSGENYIMAVWPGHNLEDLTIESSQLLINNGTLSSFMNYAGHALQTSSDILVGTTQVAPTSISTLNLSVSSINGNDARPAYTNNIMLSTMELYAASTTLMYWDGASPSSNINTSGYDAVVGVDGTYKIGVSYQFISGGSPSEVEFFVLKNNNVIVRSGGIVEVQNNQEIVQYAEILETCANGDVIQAGCFTSGAGVFASTINGNVIQSPAVILTMYKLD